MGMGKGVEEPLLVIEEGVCNWMKEIVDELEETLSLSDLPLHSDQEFSLTSNSSSHNQDCFEFFIQEPNAGFPPENIVFCGKVILSPCKPDHQAEMKKIHHHHHHHTWRLKKMYNTNKLGKGHGFPTRRKPKWYFFLFGISRFSPVVELTDIKSRRSCRPPPPRMFDGFWGLIRALSCGAPPSDSTILPSPVVTGFSQ